MNQQRVWDAIAEYWNSFREIAPIEVREFIKKQKGGILDLGCGTGRNLVPIKGIKYYCIDFSAEMLKFAEKKAIKEKVCADFFRLDFGKEKLPFKTNFFDSAIYISTLHSLETKKERKNSLKELYRVLKRGKTAMISVWDKKKTMKFEKIKSRSSWVNWKRDGKIFRRYYYFYSESELKKLLKSVGFKIIENLQNENQKKEHSKKNIIFYVCKRS